MINKKTTWSAFIIYTIILTIATLAPGELVREVNVFKISDKISHAVSFGLWSGILFSIYVFYYTGINRINFIKSVIYGFLFGTLIEILQLVLPVNRSFEYADIVADTFGAFLIVYLLNWVFKRKKTVLF